RNVMGSGPRWPGDLLEAVELRRVSMRDTLGDVEPELAEDAPGPHEESIEHRGLEEPRGPDIHADHEAVGHLLDQRFPAGIERPGLRRERRRPLEVHTREIDEQIRVKQQEPIEPTGRPLAAVGQDDRALPMRGELTNYGYHDSSEQL